jgi:uncharacterized protein HemX
MGSYTTPAELLLTAPEDTRSSETIGTEPLLSDSATNRGLLVFWAIVFALELAFAFAARWL